MSECLVMVYVPVYEGEWTSAGPIVVGVVGRAIKWVPKFELDQLVN